LIQVVTISVFCMVSSSAASERGFITMGFIHSESRNRLGPVKVKKLTLVNSKTNAPQRWRPGVDWEESESEDELNMDGESSDDESFLYDSDDKEGSKKEQDMHSMFELNNGDSE
jgi:hAT family C-terminal dimerisation region